MKVDLFEDASMPHYREAAEIVRNWPSSTIMQDVIWPEVAAPSRLQSYLYFTCRDNDGGVASAGCIRMTRMFRGRFKASLRRGPCTKTPEALVEVVPALEAALRRRGAISIALNPNWLGEDALRCEAVLQRAGYAAVPVDEQTLPTATAIIDLQGSDDDLLRSFSQRRRRDLRGDAQAGVQVRPVASVDEAARVSGIMREMAQRTGMETDGQHDFAAHFRILEQKPDLGAINVALLDGVIVGGSVTYREADRGYALLVATAPEMRGGRSTALYWQNILDVKAWGCTELDLVGYPDPRLASTHGTEGRQEFKDSFRPRIVVLPPIMEKVLRPVEAAAYRKLRRIYRGSRWKARVKAILHRSA